MAAVSRGRQLAAPSEAGHFEDTPDTLVGGPQDDLDEGCLSLLERADHRPETSGVNEGTSAISTINFSSIEDALPAFVAVILIPLTLSITQGILWGFLRHALLYGVTGRWREVGLTLWILAALSGGLLLLGH